MSEEATQKQEENNQGYPQEGKKEEEQYVEPQGMRDEKGRFVEGHPGHPKAGRPAGKISILAKVKDFLYENPKKMEELVQDYINNPDHRQLLFQMIDGRPRQDVTSAGEKLPTPLLMHVRDNDSDKENPPPEGTD